MLDRILIHACATVLALFSVISSLDAQDMRVYTTVNELPRGTTAGRVVSHSLTLFHAGKVYDYMEEAGEVVIYEPVHHRFVILGKNYTATEVPFAEVNHALESTRTETLRVLDQIRAQPDERSQSLATLMHFQLDPKFESTLDAAKQRFEMNSEPLSYSVQTAKIDSPQFIVQYLDYADWAARLNFVLRKSSTFPESRLQLNEELRRQELLPTQVELQFLQPQRPDPVRLRAEHQFTWEFQSVDRKHISHWERQLRSNDLRWLTFQEYQQSLVSMRTK